MPFSAIYPEVYGDVIRMGVGAYKAQINSLCARLIEYHYVSYI